MFEKRKVWSEKLRTFISSNRNKPVCGCMFTLHRRKCEHIHRGFFTLTCWSFSVEPPIFSRRIGRIKPAGGGCRLCPGTF